MYRHRYAQEEGLGNVFIGKLMSDKLRHLESRYFMPLLPVYGKCYGGDDFHPRSTSNVRWANKRVIHGNV